MSTRSAILFIGFLLSAIPPAAEAGLESGVAAFQNEEYQTAYQELHSLAEAGDSKAQYYLGLMYYSGKGVNQSYAEAVKWVLPAAESGIADAQYLLAVMFESGLIGPKKKTEIAKTEAAKWLILASEQGHVNAQVRLADRYLRGEGVPQDVVQAYMWCGIAHLLAPTRCNPQDFIPSYQTTSAQRDEGKQRVQEWLAKHPSNSAPTGSTNAQQLIAELGQADPKRREEIKASLIRMGDAASPAILDAFRGNTIKHTDLLASVLCERGSAAAGAIPELIRLFRNPTVSNSVKHHFLQSLACVGKTSPDVQALLIAQTKGGDDSMRPWAVMCLERFDSPESVVALAGALNDSQRSVREAAAGVLSGMGPKAASAVPALAKAVNQRGTYLSMLAGDALRAIGTPEAIAVLKKHERDNGSGPSE